MSVSGNGEAVIIGIFSVLMGIISFALSQSIFNFFFVPVVIAVLWDYSNQMNKLKKKVADLESEVAGRATKPS